jgi:hypothetical protein
MATPIVDAVISSDLKADPDQIWAAQALANTGTITSDEFILGQTMGGVEIKVVVVAGATLNADVTIELKTSATTGTGYATKLTEVVAGTTVLAAGDEIARFILPREVSDEIYTTLDITTAGADQAVTVDAYPVFVS